MEDYSLNKYLKTDFGYEKKNCGGRRERGGRTFPLKSS